MIWVAALEIAGAVMTVAAVAVAIYSDRRRYHAGTHFARQKN